MKKIRLMMALTLAVGLFAAGLVLAGDLPAPVEKKNAGGQLPTPRFTIQADTNCVVDNLTGLMWARDANLPGTTQSWTQAIAFCKSLNYGGQADWRLPSFNELASLIDLRYSRPSLSNTAGTGKLAHNDPFKNLQDSWYYWASTTTEGEPGGAWLVSMFHNAGSVNPDTQTTGLGNAGSVSPDTQTTGSGCVWPVRGGK